MGRKKLIFGAKPYNERPRGSGRRDDVMWPAAGSPNLMFTFWILGASTAHQRVRSAAIQSRHAPLFMIRRAAIEYCLIVATGPTRYRDATWADVTTTVSVNMIVHHVRQSLRSTALALRSSASATPRLEVLLLGIAYCA